MQNTLLENFYFTLEALKHAEFFGEMGRTNIAKVSPMVCLFFFCIVQHSWRLFTSSSFFHLFSALLEQVTYFSSDVARLHLISVYICKCAQMYL